MAEPISSTVFSIVLKAIIGKGFSFAKNKTVKAYQSYFGDVIKLDAERLGGELQKAAYQAQLYATALACESCLAELSNDNSSEAKWLIELAKSLKKKIDILPSQYVQTTITDQDSLNLFQTETENPQEFQDKLLKKLHEETFNLIRTDTDSFNLFSVEGFNLLKSKIENGWERDIAPQLPPEYCSWFDIVCQRFQHEYNSNPRLNAEIQNYQHLQTVSQLNSIVENLPTINEIYTTAKDIQEKVNFLYENQQINSVQTKPTPVLNLPNLDVKVYGREEEKQAILQALWGDTDSSRKHNFALIVAPSAFGKTYLLTKALQDVVSRQGIMSEFGNKLRAIILIDCKLIQNFSQIISQFNTLLGTQLIFENETNVQQWLNENLFPLTNQTETIWLMFDNFESWLNKESNYEIVDTQIREFLNALFENNHGLRGIFLSQSEPERDIKLKLNKLESVGAELFKGLPKEDALNYLRTEGAIVGLDKADEELLRSFLEKVHYIPQALSSLIGYLVDKSDYTFADFMADESFWSEFDLNEQDETALEKGIRRTKALIARQIKNESSNVKILLQFLAFLDMPTSRESLELLFSSKAVAANFISRLHSHNLANFYEDKDETKYYELHAYFREQSRKVLTKFEEEYSDYLAPLANQIGNEGIKSRQPGYIFRANNLLNLAGKIFAYLAYKNNIREIEADVALNAVNKSYVLVLLGKLTEAYDEVGKAIKIYEQLVIEKKVESLSNPLATAYMCKGFLLRTSGKLDAAYSEINKAVEINESLISEKYDQKIAIDLAGSYINRGSVSISLGKLEDSIIDFDKAIGLFERIVYSENKSEFISYLPGAYLNKSNALHDLGRLEEAVEELNKSISILEKLVNEEKREELANSLAAAYMNKGNAKAGLFKFDEAIAVIGRSIKIREELVFGKKKEDLIDDLANTYMNLGLALFSKSKFNESITEFDKAIRIYEKLVNTDERKELNITLAMCYVNKGNSLDHLKKHDKSVDEYDKAIRIYEQLINEEKYEGLAIKLATVYLNKGVTLLNWNKHSDSVIETDKGIAIIEQLVEKGRKELQDDLARAYLNKGVSLAALKQLTESLDAINESVALRIECLERGETHIQPKYIRSIAVRIRILILMKNWENVANDVEELFQFLPILNNQTLPKYFISEVREAINHVCFLLVNMPSEWLELVYKNIKNADRIKYYVNDFKKHTKTVVLVKEEDLMLVKEKEDLKLVEEKDVKLVNEKDVKSKSFFVRALERIKKVFVETD